MAVSNAARRPLATDLSDFAELPASTCHRATWVARVLTVVYFLFFALMPWYTVRANTKPVPERVTWK